MQPKGTVYKRGQVVASMMPRPREFRLLLVLSRTRDLGVPATVQAA
jgi:hypothetical protein